MTKSKFEAEELKRLRWCLDQFNNLAKKEGWSGLPDSPPWVYLDNLIGDLWARLRQSDKEKNDAKREK